MIPATCGTDVWLHDRLGNVGRNSSWLDNPDAPVLG